MKMMMSSGMESSLLRPIPDVQLTPKDLPFDKRSKISCRGNFVDNEVDFSSSIDDTMPSPNTEQLQIYRNVEGSLSCNLCNYTTWLIGNMKRHMKTHTKERPFACPYCSYKASLKQHLERHFIVHLRDLPFACDSCPFRAREKTSLDQHIISSHMNS